MDVMSHDEVGMMMNEKDDDNHGGGGDGSVTSMDANTSEESVLYTISKEIRLLLNKLGLSWAKFSSSLDWTLLQFSVDLVFPHLD